MNRSRAYRRHQRERTKARHLRDWSTSLSARVFGSPPPKDIAVRHPLDCGNPRCGLCHSEKLYGGKLYRRDRDARWREEATE